MFFINYDCVMLHNEQTGYGINQSMRIYLDEVDNYGFSFFFF